MKLLLVCLFLLTMNCLAADHVWLTIYDQNYAVVRDVRSFTLVKGVNEVRFPDISRMILDAPVRVSGDGLIARDQTFLYHRLNNDFLLQEQLGKKLELILNDSTKTVISGTLVGQPRGGQEPTFLIQEADGRLRTVRVADVHDYRYPGLSPEYELKPALTFQLESASAGPHDVEAAYEVQGLDWDARYLLDLAGDDSTAVFSGWAVIKNGAGHDFDHARLTLVSGQAPRTNLRRRVTTDERISMTTRSISSYSQRGNPPPPPVEQAMEVSAKEMAIEYRAPQHEQLFNLQTYTLPYETDLADGVEKEMNLFVPATIKTSTSYEYAHWQNGNRVGVYVHTVNADSMGLGVPIPAGPVEIYRLRAGNIPEYVGEDRVGTVDKNDPIRFRVGYAEGLSVERKNLKHEGTSKVTDQWEVKLHNDRDTDVNVTIQDFWSGKGKVLSSSHPTVETSPKSFEIPVTVPAEGDVVVTYEVRTWKSWEKKR